jgi:ribulose 1,5-bisphosphate carboxylase large subunit-like protein
MITTETISAIYDTVGLSSTRRIDFMIEVLSQDLKNKNEAEQTRIIKKIFYPYKLFKFDKFTQLITNDIGKPLGLSKKKIN